MTSLQKEKGMDGKICKRCAFCSGTAGCFTRDCSCHSPQKESDWEKVLDEFIKKWVPNYYGHLCDTDENDGQRLRETISDAIATAVAKREADIIEYRNQKIHYFKQYMGKNQPNEMVEVVSQAIANREKEIAEEVEKLKIEESVHSGCQYEVTCGRCEKSIKHSCGKV